MASKEFRTILTDLWEIQDPKHPAGLRELENIINNGRKTDIFDSWSDEVTERTDYADTKKTRLETVETMKKLGIVKSNTLTKLKEIAEKDFSMSNGEELLFEAAAGLIMRTRTPAGLLKEIEKGRSIDFAGIYGPDLSDIQDLRLLTVALLIDNQIIDEESLEHKELIKLAKESSVVPGVEGADFFEKVEQLANKFKTKAFSKAQFTTEQMTTLNKIEVPESSGIGAIFNMFSSHPYEKSSVREVLLQEAGAVNLITDEQKKELMDIAINKDKSGAEFISALKITVNNNKINGLFKENPEQAKGLDVSKNHEKPDPEAQKAIEEPIEKEGLRPVIMEQAIKSLWGPSN